MKHERIAIIGGGLGGLALARRLTAQGLQVRVYERDSGPDARTQGYRISLNALGRAALTGLVDIERIAVRDVGTGFTFATSSMKPLLTLRDADAVTVRRPALRACLLEGLSVKWDRRLSGLTERDGEVQLSFDNGTTEVADFVVGCDGVGSKVRAAMGEAAPRIKPNGFVIVGGYVTRSQAWNALLPLEQHGSVQYLDPKGRCLFTSFCEREDGAPRLLWALSGRGDPEPHGDWHPVLRKLIEATEEPVAKTALSTTHFSKKQPRTLWPSGRVTLLGDAAHTMPPQRGLGGNNALEDARLLGTLWGQAPLRDVVEQYEAEMFSRAARAVEESDESAALCHFANPFAVFARSAALRTLMWMASLHPL